MCQTTDFSQPLTGLITTWTIFKPMDVTFRNSGLTLSASLAFQRVIKTRLNNPSLQRGRQIIGPDQRGARPRGAPTVVLTTTPGKIELSHVDQSIACFRDWTSHA